MKNIHPLTTAGIGLAVGSLTCLFSGFPMLATAFAFTGYFFTLPEVPKYTSVYQFIMFPIHGLLMGLSLDYGHSGIPVLSILLPLIAIAPLLRLVFFNQMVHTKLLWVEPALTVIFLAVYLSFNIIQHREWPSWVFPILPMAFNVYLFQGFLVEGIAYNRAAKQSKMISVGTEAPDFELFDQLSQPVSLSSFRGKRNILLIFVRGDWCPACHMMMRTYERSREKFQKKNVMLLAIGPDSFDVNRGMAEKLGLDFRILSDEKQEVAVLYGTHQGVDPVNSKLRVKYEPGLPMPASFLICDKGIIRYHSRADRAGEFLQPEAIFEVLEKLS
jgi:peroxiredoxin